jgi:hypothetical protein
MILTAATLLVVGAALAPRDANAVCYGAGSIKAECPITGGSARWQYGNVLPFPFAAANLTLAPPTGPITSAHSAQGVVVPISGAKVSQGGTAAPQSIMMKQHQLSWPGTQPFNAPLHFTSPSLFSVQTRLPLKFPRTTVTFAAGGRTGPPTIVACPPPAPHPSATFDPGCLGPNTTASGGPTIYSGLLKYTATANQFGGPALADGETTGTAQIAANFAGILTLPCTACVFGRQIVNVSDQFVPGAPWSFTDLRVAIPNTPGIFLGSISALGLVTNTIGPTPSGFPFPGQTSTSFGGPWTTGMITVSAPTANPPDLFTFTGSDQRTPLGEGSISLVSAGLAIRTITDGGATMGWLTINVPEPTVMAGLFAGIGMLAALHRRRIR